MKVILRAMETSVPLRGYALEYIRLHKRVNMSRTIHFNARKINRVDDEVLSK